MNTGNAWRDWKGIILKKRREDEKEKRVREWEEWEKRWKYRYWERLKRMEMNNTWRQEDENKKEKEQRI